MPFPIEVFAGINATTRLKDGIMELAPGEQGAIYRFFNLKEKQAPRIQIRAKPQNTLRKKYGELFSEDQVGFEHDGERWTMPLKFEHNTNLVGETCFAYIDCLVKQVEQASSILTFWVICSETRTTNNMMCF